LFTGVIKLFYAGTITARSQKNHDSGTTGALPVFFGRLRLNFKSDFRFHADRNDNLPVPWLSSMPGSVL
jgi:hypothetical protein